MAKEDEDIEEKVDEVERRVAPEESLVDIGDKIFDKTEKKDEPAESEEKPKEEPKEASEEKEDSPSEDKSKEQSEEDGYYADEGSESEPSEDVVDEVREEWKNLSPLQQYLAENIQPLTIQGTIDGKERSLQVYAVENIPDNFEFASHSAERLALVNLARMDTKATDLERQFNLNQQQTEAQRFTEQENRDIQSDIADLQRNGDIPLFTRGMDVDTDPKAETAREVLDFYNRENTARARAAQEQGRLYHHISYKDAYYLWKAQNPEKVSEEQKAEDRERRQITRRTARTGQGAQSREVRKTNLPRTASWDQVINAAYGE